MEIASADEESASQRRIDGQGCVNRIVTLNLVQHFPSIGWCLTNRKTHTTNSMIELMIKQA